ncbi:MAG: hypothetical protein KGR17_03830 [Acidobacteria bacterium]|nr:hypothetical protein [Acidobacteriota bacterium]
MDDRQDDQVQARSAGGGSRRVLQRAGVGAVATVALAGVLVGGLTAAGAVGGLPGILDDSPESTTSTTEVTVPESTTSTTETTLAPPTVPAPPTRVIDVPGVGQVVVLDGPVPTVVSVTALPGFTVQPDDDPSEPGEVHLRFVDAFGGRIDVQAEYEDGQLRVRVRDRRLEESGGRRDDDGSDDGSDDRGSGDSGSIGNGSGGSDDGRRGRGRGGDDAPAPGGGPASGGASSGSAPSSGSGGGADDSGADDSGRGRGGDDSGSDDSGRGRGRGGDDDSGDRDDDD